jgi:hypothetical protein
MNYRNPIAALIVLLTVSFPAIGKDATIRGRAVLDSGAPANGAEVIVKDSWAGFFVMRERVLYRTTTNEKGEFSTPKLKYRHTIDILIMGKPCGWLASNGTILATDQVALDSYNVTIKMPATKPCSARLQPNNSFKPNLLRGGSVRLALR